MVTSKSLEREGRGGSSTANLVPPPALPESLSLLTGGAKRRTTSAPDYLTFGHRRLTGFLHRLPTVLQASKRLIGSRGTRPVQGFFFFVILSLFSLMFLFPCLSLLHSTLFSAEVALRVASSSQEKNRELTLGACLVLLLMQHRWNNGPA